MVLTKGDVPSGWTASAADDSEDSSTATFFACVGVPDSSPHQVAEADSPDFNQGEATISSSATSYQSSADVDSDAKAFADPDKANDCGRKLVQDELTQSMPAGSKIDHLQVNFEAKPAGLPDNVAALLNCSLVVTVSGQSVPVYVDVAFIRGVTVEANASFVNLGTPVADALQKKLITIVATRVANH